jgi:predicted alpha/beta hydrolase family esterase
LDILNRERKEPIKKAVLVSGFLHALWNETFDKLNMPFIQQKRNREQIRKNAETFVILHWDNDPYVPMKEATSLYKILWGTLEIITNGGHLNQESDFQTFEDLLKYL